MSENERKLVKAPASTPRPQEPESSGSSHDTPAASGRSRRRRRGAAETKPPQNRAFYFVDSNSSSKEKRAHVMHHHVQEKRKQRKMSHETLAVEEDVSEQTEVESPNIVEAASMNAPDTPSQEEYSLQIRFASVKPHPHPTGPSNLGSPVTILDASRKDPFSSLPMAYDREDLDLADYWTSKLCYWSGQNPYLKNQIFRTAMGHPLSFQAVILAYCARWKAQLYGLSDSKEIQRHVGQAKKLIEDAAATGSTQVKEDDLVMAMAGMALQEERFGSKEDAQKYADWAVQIMRPRTGTNMPVEAFLQYVRYIMTPSQSTTIVPASWRWLVTFLRGAEELMRKHSAAEYLTRVPPRREAFQMESPLFPLLSSGPRPSQVPHASRMYVVRDDRTQEVSRTAALIYITAALWDLQESPENTGRFLRYLCTLVREHHLDQYPACETLVWLLLEEGCDSDLRDPERGWSTGELLKAHKQLRPDLQFQFNEILMSFLALRSPIRGIDVFVEGLEVGTVGPV
ncbi:uncharacterized protein PFLUO_LOCUS4806 [Penicillium psychrofluorescens]|uniref:uncharacterized protein n=1 Tax=Penicillium psychrofluorescens TaxID=3158075 RepID=UPI003CCD194E